MGRKNLDKCDALYCRDDAIVTVHKTVDGQDEAVKLCEGHWSEHCDDKIVDLGGGRQLMPVVLMTVSESVTPTGVKRAGL